MRSRMVSFITLAFRVLTYEKRPDSSRWAYSADSFDGHRGLFLLDEDRLHYVSHDLNLLLTESRVILL